MVEADQMSSLGLSSSAPLGSPSSMTPAPIMARTRSSNKSATRKLLDTPSSPSSQDSNDSEFQAASASAKAKGKGKKPAAVSGRKKKKTSRAETKAQEDVAYEYVPVAQMKDEGRKFLSYHLSVRQQPMAARMCGIGEKSDRRPLDPTPVIQLQVIDNSLEPEKRKLRRPKRFGQNYLQRSVDPYYFCFACLVSGEPDATDDELHVVDNGKHRSLTGTPVSSLYHLKDLDNNDAAFFVFPDLGVRKEGRYRLKMTVYEIVDHRYVHFCDSIFTDSFTVFSAKKFPGMSAPTALSQAFQEQGLKIRVRKQTKIQLAKNKRKAELDAQGQFKTDSKRARPPAAIEWDSGRGPIGYPDHQPAFQYRPGAAHPGSAMPPPPVPHGAYRPASSPDFVHYSSNDPYHHHRPASQPEHRMMPQYPSYPPPNPPRSSRQLVEGYRHHEWGPGHRAPGGGRAIQQLPPPTYPVSRHSAPHAGHAQLSPSSSSHRYLHGPPLLPLSSSDSRHVGEVPASTRRPSTDPVSSRRESLISGWPEPAPLEKSRGYPWSMEERAEAVPSWARSVESWPPPGHSSEWSRVSTSIAPHARGSVGPSEVSHASSGRDPGTPSSRAPSSQRSLPHLAISKSSGSAATVDEDKKPSVPSEVAHEAVKPTGRIGLSGLLQ